MYILFLGYLKVIFLTYCNHMLIGTETLINALVQKQLMSGPKKKHAGQQISPFSFVGAFFVNLHVHKPQMFIVILITLSKAGRPCQALKVSFSCMFVNQTRKLHIYQETKSTGFQFDS